MRVLVVAEGKHELSGALENLLKRLGSTSASFEFDRISNNTIHAVHGKGQGYFKRAVRWLKEAEERGVNALVLLIDEDGESERIEQIQSAQNYLLTQLPRAMGVAIRMFDAWMLADEKALTEVLGYRVNRQPDPETIRNPKQICAELLEESPAQIPQREMYAGISSNIDIDILSDRCPLGFEPFAKYVKNLFL
ncbi:MAG: DUF4276 family protein [Sedimentisphaerales bacterium]|nr:DUF4276 family protein [Sedimentisphaerales bacterium]